MIRLALPLAAMLVLSACSDSADPFVEEDLGKEEVSEGEERKGTVRASFGEGIVLRPVVAGGVADALARLETLLEENGFTIVAKIDHRANAASVDLDLAPSTVIVFGKPEVGSHLMQAAPSAAFDLPQRIAIYEDAEGKAVIAYSDPQYLATRHNITGQDERLDTIGSVLANLARMAAGEKPNSTAQDKQAEEKSE